MISDVLRFKYNCSQICLMEMFDPIVSLELKRSHNNQQYIAWGKIIHFSLMPKIIRILRSCSMKIFCTVNISKHNYWLVICIAKNNFKDDFLNILIFLHIFKYCPNHTSMESYLFSFQMMHASQYHKIMTGFVLQGLICVRLISYPFYIL